MPNYEDCVIFTIRSGDHLYVGSTCNFVRRKCCHKSSLNNENDKAYNYKLYQTIRENDNEWDMQPYKLFQCKNKMEMNIEEERCRVELKANMNSQSCHGTDMVNLNKNMKKWRESNKQHIKVENAKHRKKNIVKILEKVTCECGCVVAGVGNLPRHKKSNKHFKLLEEKLKINTEA